MAPPGSPSSTDRTKIALILVLAAGFATRAPADIVIADWNSSTDFDFQVRYMPDLDQRRNGLPGSGSMFCVPSATMNMFAYAAEWGVDGLAPGEGVWQGDVSYGTVTDLLNILGSAYLMNTGTTGTSTPNWLIGSQAWINNFPLVRTAYLKDDDSCPTLSDVARYASTGAIASICYGRYNFNAAPIPILGSRTSGHCVTVVYASANGANDLELWVRDPGDDATLSSQSQWAYRIYEPLENMIVRQDWDDDSAYLNTDVTVLEYNPAASQIRILDTIYTLRPGAAFSWDEIELAIDPIAPDLTWGGAPSHDFTPPEGFVLEDVEIHPDFDRFITLVRDPNGDTWTRPEFFRVLTEDDDGAFDPIPIPGATDIVVGRHRELFGVAGMEVWRRDIDDPSQVEAIGQLSAPGQRIVYCDLTDEVIVVSTEAGKATVFPRSLDSQVEYDLPPGIPPSADPSIAIRDCDGAMAIWVPEMPQFVHGLRATTPGGPLEHGVMTLTEPGTGGVAFDDQGHMLLGGPNGSVQDFVFLDDIQVDLLGDPGCWWCWETAPDSWYSGFQNRGNFQVFRSRTNYDPAINAEDDIDTPAEELAEIGTLVHDCPGDFDNSGAVGFSNLTQLLLQWGPCPGCVEDLDGDGNVGFIDLTELLSRWGPCPPVSP